MQRQLFSRGRRAALRRRRRRNWFCRCRDRVPSGRSRSLGLRVGTWPALWKGRLPALSCERTVRQYRTARRELCPAAGLFTLVVELDHGLYDVRDLGEAMAVQAAGYGGGSLIYATCTCGRLMTSSTTAGRRNTAITLLTRTSTSPHTCSARDRFRSAWQRRCSCSGPPMSRARPPPGSGHRSP